MVGCVTKSFVFKGKEFTSQHQTQHTESFPLKIKNIERYLQSKLKVSRFDYMRLLKVMRNGFQLKH